MLLTIANWYPEVPVRKRKQIVIDSDVTGSASDVDHSETMASNCYKLLVAVHKFRHYFVRTPELKEEWRRHRSNDSRRWLFWMFAKKLVRDIDDVYDQNLRDKFSRFTLDHDLLDEMLKDAHLLEGALATDKIIASRNDSERELYSQASSNLGEIREVMWVNPDTESKYCLEWLERGAPNESEHQLGFQHRKR